MTLNQFIIKINQITQNARKSQMQTADPAINMVIDNIGIMVASEGGSLELVELADDYMKVKYNAGTNEECPECVPMTDAVYQFMRASLNVHAPRIATLEVVD